MVIGDRIRPRIVNSGTITGLVSFLGVGSTSAPTSVGSSSCISVKGLTIGGLASNQANW